MFPFLVKTKYAACVSAAIPSKSIMQDKTIVYFLALISLFLSALVFAGLEGFPQHLAANNMPERTGQRVSSKLYAKIKIHWGICMKIEE